MRRTITKRLLLMVISLIILVGLTLVFVHLPFVKSRILASIQGSLAKAQGILLTVDTFDYNLFKGTVSMEGLLLEKSGGEDLPPVLQASSVHGTIPLSIIFTRKLVIENVEVTNPVISIVIDQQGGNNLPGKPGSAESGRDQPTLPDFIIRQAMIENGRVHILDERQGLEILVPGIWLRGSWLATGGHAVDMEIRLPGSVTFREKSFPLEHAELQAELFREGIDFEKLFLTLAGSDLTFAGSLEGFSSLDFEGTCEGFLDLAAISAALDRESASVSGNLEIQSELSGSLPELSAAARIKSRDLSYRSWENIQLDSEISWQNETLQIRSLDLENEEGEIRASGNLSPLDWSGGSSLDIKWQGLDLAPLSDTLESPFPLASVSSGNMQISWEGLSLDEVTGKCEVRLGGNNGTNDSAGRAEITGEILAQSDQEGIQAEFRSISVSGAILNGNFRSDAGGISGSYRMETEKIAGAMPLIQAFAPSLDDGIIKKAGLDGPVSVAGKIAGTLGKPVVTFDVASDSLEFLNVRDIVLKGNLVYDGQSIGIESLLALDRNGKLSISGSYPLGPPKRTMQFEIEGEALPLERILFILGSPVEATGTLAVNSTIEGNFDSPEIRLNGSVSDAYVYGQAVEKLEFSGEYSNRKIVLDSISARRLSGVLEGSGFYDVSGKDFNLNLKADSFPVRELSLPGIPEAVSAGLDVELTAEGGISDPEISSRGRLREVFIGPRDLGDLDFEIKTEGGELAFQAESSLYASSIKGSVPMGSPRVLKMELETDLMPLDVVRKRILLLEDYDFSGSMTSRVKIEIDLENTENKIEAKADIELIQLNKGEHSIRNRGPIAASYSEEVLLVENMVLTGAGTEIEARGMLSSRNPEDSEFWANATVDLAMLKEFIPELESAGSLRVESEFRGAIKNPIISAEVEISGAEVQHSSIPVFLEGIESSINIRENVIGIDSLTFQFDDSQFEVKGRIPLESLPLSLPEFFSVDGEREANLAVSVKDFDPSVLALIHSREMAQSLSGRLSGRLDLRGRELHPDKIFGEANFETFELIVSGIPLKQEARTLIRLEKGALSFQEFVLVEGDNRLDLSGTADITGNGGIDLLLRGEFGLSRLRKFDRKGVFSGRTIFEIRAGESYANPSIQGFLDVRDGRMRRLDPSIFIEQLNGRIEFLEDRIRINEIAGALNGGKLVVNGKAGLEGMDLKDVAINLRAVNSAIEFPEGLRSVVSGDFRLTSRDQGYLLAGSVAVIDSRYTDDFTVGSSLSRIFRKDPARDLFEEPSPYLEQLGLNISLRTQKKMIIDNNISKSQATANIKISGTADHPSLAGRMNLADGGELFFNQNTFTIDRGTVDFVNPTRIEPDLNLSASTKVKEYDITLVLQGVPEKLTASLVSDPPLSEPNIVSLLVTGRTLESASASILSVAGSTALSYLNSSLTGKVEQATARALGLESVRIDSGLISTEENPEARITLGQHLSRDFELVFSQGLKDARNQMWMTNYNPFQNFNIQGIKRDDNEYNLAFSHDVLFGLKSNPDKPAEEKPDKKEPLMGEVELSGNLGMPESEIIKKLKWKRGKSFSVANLQDSLERVRELYRKEGYLGFSLNSGTEEKNGRLDLALRIDSGPKVILEYRGADVPKNLKKEILDAWIGSSFGQLAREDISQRIQVHLLEERYYQAAVQSLEEKDANGDRTIIFNIDKGIRFNDPIIRFQGNRMVASNEISDYLRENELEDLAFYDPEELKSRIEAFYGRGGFLRPEVELPVIRFEPERKEVFLEFSVKEGDRFKVEVIDVSGVDYFKDEQILVTSGIRPGDTVSPERFSQVEDNIEEMYLKKGFNDVRVQSGVEVNAEKGTVDLSISVEENLGWIVEEIQISGNLMTDEQVIRREIKLKKGDEVNFRVINESRKRLYDLGVFERVNIEVLPVESGGQVSSVSDDNQTSTAVKPFRVLVEVEEIEPYRLRYGLQYDTDSSFGIMGSLVDRNFFGNAFLVGSSLRLNRNERDARAFFRSPHMFANKINTEFHLFYNQVFKEAFDVDRTGFTLQQQFRVGETNLVSYNYSFEKIGTFIPGQEGEADLDETERIGTFNLAFTHDSRNDILNATRGMFLSNSIRYAPGLLGSDIRYFRYFGQYSTYKKVTDFLIYASSIRVGLGKGFGAELPLSERFFAGGGTTIRGFRKDELGPLNPETNIPLGGDAVFILNQELRSSLYKKFGTAAFLDLGNVYPGISDFDPTDLRKTAGFGLRYQTPFIMIRLDWGFKLDRRPGESLSQIFFSIGQAF